MISGTINLRILVILSAMLAFQECMTVMKLPEVQMFTSYVSDSIQTKHAFAKIEEIDAQDTHDDTKKEEKIAKKKDDIFLPSPDIMTLQSLAGRREELESWSDNLMTKEKSIVAIEHNVQNNIAKLKDMQRKIESLIAQYNSINSSKMQNLVKIYETMNPKEAAVIFNEMESDMLVRLVNKMQTMRVSPILAKMTPDKATYITAKIMNDSSISNHMKDL